MSWYAAALGELHTLLDQIGEEGSVTLEPDSVGTAAIVAVLEGGGLVYAAGNAANAAVTILSKLEEA